MEKSKGETTRDIVVQAAYQLIIEQGYHGTSMRQIAQKAGIALGGIYNHFSGKEDIFKAVVFDYHPYHEFMPAMFAAEGETVEALFRNAVRNLVPILQERQDIFNLMFIEMVEFNGRHVPEIFEKIYPPLLDFIQKLGQADGRLRNLAPSNLIRAFASLMLGYMITEQLLAKQFPPDSNVSALQEFVEIYLHGILEG